MSLDWLPREDEVKNHELFKGEDYFGTEAPCTKYEKKPIIDPEGNEVEGLYSA